MVGACHADSIQLWCRITKTEYPSPPDTGNLPSAVSYLTEIYVQVWEELAEIPDAKRRFNAAEHLVHTTKKNPARFDFDLRFPKMPSYLRRAAIQHALGTVSSYETRLELWEKTGEKAGKPKLDMKIMPCRSFTVMSCTVRKQKERRSIPETV